MVPEPSESINLFLDTEIASQEGAFVLHLITTKCVRMRSHVR